MADNNTFVFFEEIKNKLETIYRELKELKEKENGSVFPPYSIYTSTKWWAERTGIAQSVWTANKRSD